MSWFNNLKIKNKLYGNFLCSTAITVLILQPFSVNRVYGQDYKKVIEVVQKMESNLKAQIANEQKSREKEIAELREQIQSLQKGSALGENKKLSTEHEKIDFSKIVTSLKEGNERYVTGSLSKKEYAEDRTATINAQHPYAIILTCADSRVPPELIFDESIGKLFVVRDAGNVVDSVILGSIEYAAEHLHVRLLLILGHESCGAVTATITGGEVSPNIGSLVTRMKSPVEKIKAGNLKDKKLVSACVEENVLYQMKQAIKQSDVLHELVENDELLITGGVYNLDSGRVKFLDSRENPKNVDKVEASHDH